MATDRSAAVSESGGTRIGRPRRLSPEAILDAASELLDELPLESFTLAKLAARLGASTMSLYTYYASRDVLLEAVAERAFQRFEAPEASGTFAERALAWLWALQRHVEQHPVAMKVMAWNGRLPAAWLRVWTPMLRLLHDQGLEGGRLAVTFDWFINSAIGLMITERHAIELAKSASIADIGALAPEDGMLLLRFLYDLQQIGPKERFDLGFRRLVEGLEACVAEGWGNA
jgi:AcrR family transcriptional regulator